MEKIEFLGLFDIAEHKIP